MKPAGQLPSTIQRKAVDATGKASFLSQEMSERAESPGLLTLYDARFSHPSVVPPPLLLMSRGEVIDSSTANLQLLIDSLREAHGLLEKLEPELRKAGVDDTAGSTVRELAERFQTIHTQCDAIALFTETYDKTRQVLLDQSDQERRKLTQSREKNMTLEQKVKMLERQLSEAVRGSFRAQIESEQKLRDLRTHVKMDAKTIKRLQTDLAERHRKLSSQTAQMERMGTNLEELERKTDAVKMRADRDAENFDAARKRVEKMSAQNARDRVLEREKIKQETSVALEQAVRKAARVRDKQIAALERKVKTKSREVDVLQDTLAHQDELLRQLRPTLADEITAKISRNLAKPADRVLGAPDSDPHQRLQLLSEMHHQRAERDILVTEIQTLREKHEKLQNHLQVRTIPCCLASLASYL